jgi:hypothetical protein
VNADADPFNNRTYFASNFNPAGSGCGSPFILSDPT